jgi:hypothetical protein
MKSSSPKKAIHEIAELTGVEISEDNLFLESIVTSNARLKFDLKKVCDCVEMNRIPANFRSAHFLMLGTVLSFSIIGLVDAQKGRVPE